MTESSGAFQRIEPYVDAFLDGIKRCRTSAVFDAADWQDAYGRFWRLRERYREEKCRLRESERQALSKVFDDDDFIKGVEQIRHVGEHITRTKTYTIYTPAGDPITLETGSSARDMFAANTVWLTDTKGEMHRVDHLEMLEALERRITNAIRKARE
jgi:hypothetical protein